ncbi:TPA: hypothetical protein QIB48_000032 [Morganella morganii subsp. morganii]|nr:hypothetical protein [Morganella morganii subsp. morganii]
MENVYLLADYQEIFGKPLPEISDVLGNKVSSGMLATLSMLSWKNRTPEINEWVVNNITLKPAEMIAVRDSFFLKRSSCFLLWKFLIKNHFEYNLSSDGKKDEHYESIIRCLTILNENERNKENMNGYLMNNGFDFYRDNYYWQINRAMRSMIHEKRMDIYISNFQKFNNIKLTDYMKVHSYLTRRFNDGASKLASVRPSVWVINLDALAKATSLNSEEVEKIMTISSFSIDDFRSKESDFENENNWYDFLCHFPYFRLSEKNYIPINGKLAEDLLYNELFFKIKKANPDPSSFMRDYGYCFEDYIAELIKLTCVKSKRFKYKYIPEYEYDLKSKKSSDAYIYFRDEVKNIDVVIVIEAKAKRIREQAKIINPRKKDIQLSINKTIKEPLSQALGVTCDIIKKNIHKELTKEKLYYFISVSMNSYTIVTDDFDLSLTPIHREKIKIGGIYPVAIEGFECFMRILMSDYSNPANDILDDFNKVSQDISFKTHMARIYNNKNVTSKDFDEYINKSIEMTMK